MIFLEVTVTGSELTGRGVGCMRQPGCRSTESTLGDGRYWAPIPEPGPRRRMSPPTLPTVRQQIDTGTSSGVVVPPPPPPPPGPQTVSWVCGQQPPGARQPACCIPQSISGVEQSVVAPTTAATTTTTTARVSRGGGGLLTEGAEREAW